AEVLGIGLQPLRLEDLEDAFPLVLVRMPHHGDANDVRGNPGAERLCLLGRDLTRRLGEHEPERVDAGRDGHLDGLGAVHSADLHEHRAGLPATAARPAAIKSASAASGSAARISEEPTSAKRKPSSTTASTSA